jgi:serine/threonine protein kinase
MKETYSTLRYRPPVKKEPPLPKIEEYTLLEPWRNTNSGNARWSFATKNAQTFFIKEFLSPVFPEKGVLSPEAEAAKRKICFNYYRKKNELYKKIEASATGNLVLIKDFFLCGTKYYVTTEKIEQCNLTAEKIVSVPEEKKLLLLKILAFSLSKLHENGVVHADLKPTNVLIKLSETGQVVAKIIDFDGSYLEGDQPKPDDVQGDQIYYAPETCRYVFGEDVKLTTKVDVFACGLLFHLYLTGALPKIKPEYDYMYEALLDDSELTLSPKLSKQYAELIRSMLSREPEDRPTMEQVLEQLKEIKISNPWIKPAFF